MIGERPKGTEQRSWGLACPAGNWPLAAGGERQWRNHHGNRPRLESLDRRSLRANQARPQARSQHRANDRQRVFFTLTCSTPSKALMSSGETTGMDDDHPCCLARRHQRKGMGRRGLLRLRISN